METPNIAFTDLLSEQASLYPDKIAIKHHGQSITYHELDSRSNQVAAYFIDHNIKKNDVVAVAMDRSISLVICLLGLMKARAAYLPIDPHLPADRINYIFENSGAKFLCTVQKYTAFYG